MATTKEPMVNVQELLRRLEAAEKRAEAAEKAAKPKANVFCEIVEVTPLDKFPGKFTVKVSFYKTQAGRLFTTTLGPLQAESMLQHETKWEQIVAAVAAGDRAALPE